MTDNPAFLTVNQVAARIGKQPNWTYQLLKRGDIPSFKEFGRRLVRAKDLEEYLAKPKAVSI